jgi:tRNA(Ile)-lysidine synthase
VTKDVRLLRSRFNVYGGITRFEFSWKSAVNVIPRPCTIIVRLLRKLLQFVRSHALVKPGDRIGLAVSGGADSVALLRAFLEARAELGCILSVVHLHHGLRGSEADADAEFVRKLAVEHSLEFHTTRRDVRALAADSKLSIEAAGRAARLQFFAELQSQGILDKIATAHTANDQAETVLLKFLRGAGTRGLSAIYPIANHSGATLIRPLLDVTRVEIERYLHELNQPWREDATNRSPEFLRNRIRHDLLPLLARDFNPSIVESLSNTADLAREEQDFWDSTIDTITRDLSADNGTIDIANFTTLHIAVQRRLLTALAPLPLDFDHIERAREFILAAQSGERELARGLRIQITRDSAGRAFFVFSTGQALSSDYALQLTLPGTLDLPARNAKLEARLSDSPRPGTALDASLAGRTLIVRNWRAGDRFQPFGRGEAKLKDFFQQMHVPATARSSWPIAELDGEIVWVFGLPVAARFAAKESGFIIEEIPLSSPMAGEEVTSQPAPHRRK